MKKLDFENPDSIVKFQKILNETMEQKIREAKTNSALNSIVAIILKFSFHKSIQKINLK